MIATLDIPEPDISWNAKVRIIDRFHWHFEYTGEVMGRYYSVHFDAPRNNKTGLLEEDYKINAGWMYVLNIESGVNPGKYFAETFWRDQLELIK